MLEQPRGNYIVDPQLGVLYTGVAKSALLALVLNCTAVRGE